MVLRALSLLIFLTGFTYSSEAQVRVTEEGKRYFSRAKDAYRKENYKKVVNLLNKGFNLRDPSTPGGALALSAYAYEKLEQWSNAQKIYAFLITRRYKSSNNLVMRQYKNSGTDDLPEVPTKLYEYYHRRAEALTQIYVARYESLSPKLRLLYKKTALMYVAILEDSDYDDDSYDTIPERLDGFDKDIKDKVFKPSWFVESSYISWRDKLQLVFPNGQTSIIESTGEGLCLGGGWRYENEFFEFNLNGCYAGAAMTVGKENSTLTYFQKGVTSSAIIAGPSILWKPKSKGASFGLNIPFVYRTGDYEEPPGFVLQDVSIFTYGYLLEAGWRFPKWGFFTKFGKIKRLSSSLWMFGTQYTF
jgi:hypothetical protein